MADRHQNDFLLAVCAPCITASVPAANGAASAAVEAAAGAVDNVDLPHTFVC